MSAFVTLSIILAVLALILGHLVVGQAYHNARRNLGERATREIKRIKDEESTLTESFVDQVARGGAVAGAVSDYKRRRGQLLPATAASLPDPALWGDHDLTTYREASIRDALTTAKRDFNLRTALLLTVVLFSAGLANTMAYFFWFSRSAAVAADADEFEPLPAATGPAAPGDPIGRASKPSGPDALPSADHDTGAPSPVGPGPSVPAPGGSTGVSHDMPTHRQAAPFLPYPHPHSLA